MYMNLRWMPANDRVLATGIGSSIVLHAAVLAIHFNFPIAARLQNSEQRMDVVLVNGDAYVDHPTFGVPLLGRVLAARGFKVVVPTDGMSSKDPFGELSAAWILANAPAGVSKNVTLTRSSM